MIAPVFSFKETPAGSSPLEMLYLAVLPFKIAAEIGASSLMAVPCLPSIVLLAKALRAALKPF